MGAKLNQVGKSNYIPLVGYKEENAKDALKAYGLTESCAACFSDSIKCGIKNCLFNCAKYQSDKCLKCITQKNCNSDLKKCAKVDDLPPAVPKKDEL